MTTQPASRALFLAPLPQAAPERTRPNATEGLDRSSAFAATYDAGASHVPPFQILDVDDAGSDAANLAGKAPPTFNAAIPSAADSGPPTPLQASTFLAQQFTQEGLSEGVYIDPHPAGIAAYRDVLNAVAIHNNGAAGVDLHV